MDSGSIFLQYLSRIVINHSPSSTLEVIFEEFGEIRRSLYEIRKRQLGDFCTVSNSMCSEADKN